MIKNKDTEYRKLEDSITPFIIHICIILFYFFSTLIKKNSLNYYLIIEVKVFIYFYLIYSYK